MSRGNAIGLALLLAGFLYSGVASVRLYGQVFSRPAAVGASNAIDAYLTPVHFSSADELRRALREAKWRPEGDVVIVAEPDQLPRQDLYQVYYSTSYALYPQRVWLATCEADAIERRPAFVLHIGAESAYHGVAGVRLSPNLSLVEWP